MTPTFYKTLSVETPYKPVLTFSHSGDLGDLIAALPTVRALGGGHLVLPPSVGMVREPWNPEKVERVRSFLELQPYVHSVKFAQKPEGLGMDAWRKMPWQNSPNLMDMVSEWAGLGRFDHSTPWLTVDSVNPVAEVVVHRSQRYPGRNFPWTKITHHWKKKMVFVGSPEEHKAFCDLANEEVPYYPTPTLLDLARVVAGATLFCGNQSSPRWIAEGLKANVWVEQYRGRRHNTFFLRPGARYDDQRMADLDKL